MKKVKQIIAGKAHYNNIVSPSDNLLNALSIMKKEDASFAIVMDHERYIGIIGEKDYSQKVILNGAHPDKLSVKDLLSTVYPVIDADDNTDSCIKMMSCYKLHYLPVFDGFNFIGVVTEYDLLEEVAREKNS